MCSFRCYEDLTTCGEGGIRTHGGDKLHNGFRDRPIQPLWHLSHFLVIVLSPKNRATAICRIPRKHAGNYFNIMRF